ncbi:MAG TPA: hypothetical protein VGX03_17795 [Candidatus Binatia bacterium]|nr:hypothetical protein [Candidatus Binatia bacterium]
MTALEDQRQRLADDAAEPRDLRVLIRRLGDFVAKVRGGLATVEWRTRREILRALVRRVELDRRQVTICRVPPPFTAPGPDGSVLPDCRRRELATPRQHRSGWTRGKAQSLRRKPKAEE